MIYNMQNETQQKLNPRRLNTEYYLNHTVVPTRKGQDEANDLDSPNRNRKNGEEQKKKIYIQISTSTTQARRQHATRIRILQARKGRSARRV